MKIYRHGDLLIRETDKIPTKAKKNPKADLCMAWKFGLTGEEYAELRSEA